MRSRPQSAPTWPYRAVQWPRRSYGRPYPSYPAGCDQAYGGALADDPTTPLTARPRDEPGPGPGPGRGRHRLSKPRRVLIITCTLLGFFFSCLDAAIVATSMVTISQELNDFVNVPWVILAYILTYMGFSVFLSRLSDIYGRRDILLASWLVFLCFSFGCARAETMIQLIVCRAFQGIGGSGLYSLAQITLAEYGPVNKPSLVGAMIGCTLAISLVLGPIIGGLISHFSNWRWIFDLNIPFSAATMLLMSLAWPAHEDSGGPARARYTWGSLRKIDFLGSAALLCACCLLVVGVQQAGAARHIWSDSVIIAVLALAALSFVAFVAWQVVLNRGAAFRDVKPIFPVNLLRNRVFTATLVVTLLTGFVYLGLMVIVPERFQIIHGDNVLMAGVQLLPLLGSCAVGSFAAGAASSKRNNTSATLAVSSALQLLGAGLTTLVSGLDSPVAALYGFQVIVGFGIGLCFTAATTLVSLQVSRADLATAHGVISQARLLGGCLGISVCTVIFNYHSDRYLRGRLDEERMRELRFNPVALLEWDDAAREMVRGVYAAAFDEQIKVMLYICAVQLAASLFALERKPVGMATLADHQMAPAAAPAAALADGRGDKQSPGRTSHSSTGTELSDMRPLAAPRFAPRSVSRDGLPI